MSLKETLCGYWLHIQEELLPWLNDTPCGPLNEHHKQLISVLGMARTSQAFLPWLAGPLGAPVVGTFGIGSGLCRESRVQLIDHPAADRDVVRRQDVTSVVRLAAQGRSAQ